MIDQEVCIFKIRCKLYRNRDEKWEDRGTGNAKLMRHKGNLKIRMVMREEKSLKLIANFMLQDAPFCELLPMKNNDKAFVWSCHECSEDPPQLEMLAARFQTLDNANLFKEAFNLARAFNALVR